MTGGTLILSRAVNLHAYYKDRAKSLGFKDISITAQEKDSLSFIIRDTKPGQVIVSASFYKSATPFMMKDLINQFPGIDISAVALGEYPDDLAMYFILNGVKSYARFWDGTEEFYRGMSVIRNGRQYVSPNVRERIEMRDQKPPSAKTLLTGRTL